MLNIIQLKVFKYQYFISQNKEDYETILNKISINQLAVKNTCCSAS